MAVLLAVCGLNLFSCTGNNQHDSSVKVVGTMSSVMWQGKLQGTIALDTITDRRHLYGIGPLENLSGELLIVDGKTYTSVVLDDTTMKVEESNEAKAPFFVYANVSYFRKRESAVKGIT